MEKYMKFLNTKNKMIGASVLVLIIVACGSFYTGMRVGENKSSASLAQGGARAGGFGGRTGMMRGGGASSGEILAKDDKSITVKLRNGGSSIIFFGPTTQVMKSAPGSMSDLIIGQSITAIGTANSDGSVSAQSIQIRPQVPTAPTSQPTN
jgi:hypothetical protein